MSRQAQAAKNREAMPGTAATVDEFRRVFGLMTRVVWASERGITVGERRAPSRAMNADQWLHFLRTGKLPAEVSC